MLLLASVVSLVVRRRFLRRNGNVEFIGIVSGLASCANRGPPMAAHILHEGRGAAASHEGIMRKRSASGLGTLVVSCGRHGCVGICDGPGTAECGSLSLKAHTSRDMIRPVPAADESRRGR